MQIANQIRHQVEANPERRQPLAHLRHCITISSQNSAV
jgi:hypothetical protein